MPAARGSNDVFEALCAVSVIRCLGGERSPSGGGFAISDEDSCRREFDDSKVLQEKLDRWVGG